MAKTTLTKEAIIDTVLDHIQSQLASSTYSAADFLKKLDHDYARTQQTEALGSEDDFEKRMGKIWVVLTHEDENIGYGTSFIKEIESLSAQIKNIETVWEKTIDQYEVEKKSLTDYLKTNKRDLIIAALEKLESQQKVNPIIQLFEWIIKSIFGDSAQEELLQKRNEDMMAGKGFTPLTGKDLFAQVITSDKPEETFKSVLNAQYKRLAEKGSVRQQAIHSLFGQTSREKLSKAIEKARRTENARAAEIEAVKEKRLQIEAKRSFNTFNTINQNVRVREPSKLTLLLDKTREEQKGRKKPGG